MLPRTLLAPHDANRLARFPSLLPSAWKLSRTRWGVHRASSCREARHEHGSCPLGPPLHHPPKIRSRQRVARPPRARTASPQKRPARPAGAPAHLGRGAHGARASRLTKPSWPRPVAPMAVPTMGRVDLGTFADLPQAMVLLPPYRRVLNFENKVSGLCVKG